MLGRGTRKLAGLVWLTMVAAVVSSSAAEARTVKDTPSHPHAKPATQARSAAEAKRAAAIQRAAAKSLRGLAKPTARDRTEAGVRVPSGVKLAAAAIDPGPRTAAAWGDGSYNQLGDGPCCGSANAHDAPIAQAVPVPGGVVQLSAGDYFYQALHADGTVSSWGMNVSGALGRGANGGYAIHAPGQVPISGVISIATGVGHTLFLTTGGLYATGDNYQGDLGRGSGCCGYFSSPVPSTLVPDAVAIAASGHTSYALQSNGTVLAFGSNEQGQLGQGDVGTRNNPVVVQGLTDVIAISASYFAGYALKSDGTVWSWGGNYLGALGNGSSADGPALPAQIPGLTNVVALGSGGEAFGGYAIKQDGSVWGWGSNESGELGNGTTTSSNVPVKAQGLDNAIQVSASNGVAMAVTDDGKAYSWGENRYGQLGDGSHGPSLTPTRVVELPGVSAIGAGRSNGAAAANIPTPAPLPSYYGPINPSGLASACIHATCADPVDTESGALAESYQDIAIPGRGLPLDLQRHYNSASADQDGPFGHGWTWSYGMRLDVDPGTGVVTVTQENGSQVVFAPDGSGGYAVPPFMAAALKHNADGTWTMTRKARTKFTFDSQGRLTTETDLNGYATRITYPSATSRVITDPAGRTLTLTLAGGRITSVTDSATPHRTVSYHYDGNGDLIDVTDVGGGITRFTYDAAHRLTTIRTPRYASETGPNNIVTNTYDASGRVISQTDPLGGETTFDYTSIEDATKVTDPKGNVRVDRYVAGRRTSTTHGYGTSKAATSRFYYDPDTFALTAACDGRGSCKTYTYDAAGNVLTQKDAMGRTTTKTYDAQNNVLTSQNPKGVTTTYTYDANGNMLTQSTPLLDANGTTIATQLTRFNYGGTTPVYAGDVTSMVDPRGKTWQYRYDAYGNRVSTTAPPTPENASGNKTTATYDTGTGWKTSETSARGNVSGAVPSQYTTSYVHDVYGRVTQVKDPLWIATSPLLHQRTTHYDANGNVDYVIDTAGNKTTYEYDAANQLVKTTRPDTKFTTREYFPDGSLKRVTSARGKTSSYTYDALGHIASSTDGAGRTTTFQSDAAGNVTVKATPGSDCSNGPFDGCQFSTYNANGELTQRTFYDGTPETRLEYDAMGNVTKMTDASGTSVWSYDGLNRLASSKDGNNNTVGYGYDIGGNLTTLTYPGNLVVTRTFDAASRMDSVKDYRNNTTTFAYDADSNLLKTTRPTATGVTNTYTYDASGTQLTSTTAKGTTTLAKFTYTRDSAGRVATATTTGITDPAQTFGYDQTGRLTRSGATATPVTHGYDDDGNLTGRATATTQAFDDAGQLCWQKAAAVPAPACGTPPTGATTYEYNSAGDRISATPATGTAQTYGYDGQHNLIKYGTTATYKYDATNLRVYKKVGTTVTRFVWDRSTPVPALLADATNRYIYGPGGRPLEQITTSNVVTYLHQDQIGSTRLLTSSTGANVGSYNYDAYGAVTARTGTVQTPLQFAGQYADSESGLLYMRARSYDPVTGQFLQRDPMEQTTGEPYSYADNDPMNGYDPTGLFCLDPTGLTCDIQKKIGAGAKKVGDFVYNNAGTIATGAGAVALVVPGLNVAAVTVLGGTALVAGGIQAYKDYHEGNYGSLVLDVAGLGAGGLALKLERMAAKTIGNATPWLNKGYMYDWFGLRGAEYARLARGINVLSLEGSLLLDGFVNPDEASGMLCP